MKIKYNDKILKYTENMKYTQYIMSTGRIMFLNLSKTFAETEICLNKEFKSCFQIFVEIEKFCNNQILDMIRL